MKSTIDFNTGRQLRIGKIFFFLKNNQNEYKLQLQNELLEIRGINR